MVFMKYTLWLLLFFSNACLFAAQPTLGSVKELHNGLYTAEGITAAGEKIYLGFERLDTQAERDAWQGYSDACQKLVDDSKGWLVFLGTHAHDKNEYKKLKDEEQFQNMDSSSFKKLIRAMRKGGFTPQGNKWENVHATRHGMAGFGPQFSSYVAYISTKPITERLYNTASLRTYSEIESHYGHLVMSVCTTVSTEKPVYENRGIFRNPLNLIKGGYSNVSCLLHVFTAKAMKFLNQSPNASHRQYLTVRALPTMKEIIVKTIGNDKVKIGDQIPEPLREFPALGFGIFDIKMLMDIDDIAGFYDAPKKQKASDKKSHKSKKKK